LHNPEELMLAALASCHMLTYLALCARAGIVVVAYEDEAAATLELAPGGGGELVEATLRPRVRLVAGSDPAAARALHARAAAQCFLARSVRFPVRHQPVVEVEPASDAPGAVAMQAATGGRP
jgi:organic hydroperoxide reductase OsmC/OhrA